MGILARLGIRAPEQTTPATPPAGSRLLYPKTGGWYDLNSAGVETALGGGGAAAPIPTNYLAPTGASYETFARNSYTGNVSTPASGILLLVAIALPVGLSVGRIAFISASTAANTPTNWWFGLYDQARVQLATTANQTTTAWAANTLKSLPIATTAIGAATTFTTTYTGVHYIGISMTATALPNLVASIGTAALNSTAPILYGTTGTSAAVPPAFPFTAGALTAGANLPYAYVGP